MKKIAISSICCSVLLVAQSIKDENLNSIELGATLAYSSYGLDIKASYFDRAIAYDVVEAQLGISYNVDNFQFGVNYTGVPQEVKTRSSIVETDGKDRADIERNQFVVHASYIWSPSKSLNKKRNERLKTADWVSLHLQYYKSSLDASNQFVLDQTFKHEYKYDTDGVKISLHYNVNPNSGKHTYWITGGVLYTQADLDFHEYRSGILQPKYVDSSVSALGWNTGAGWSYEYNNKTTIRAILDWYQVDFGEIDIMSTNQGFLQKASFEENTYSARVGISYKF